MSERRYNEDEVAEIFARATEAQKKSLSPAREPDGEGLTLAELQEVGEEVGLPPDLVAGAARSLDAMGRAHDKRLFGFLPVGVGRTVELPHQLTDAEWHRLVADLRDTFEASGKLSVHGTFRQWSNGNLQALLEPTPAGSRLRLKTLKGSALSLMSTGAMMFGITAMIWIVRMLTAAPVDGGGFVPLFVTGLALVAAGILQVPAWARTRSRQMEEIAERLALSTGPTAGERLPSP